MNRRLASVAGLMASTAMLSACALGGQEPGTTVSAGSLAGKGDLKGVDVTVGGKEFTEQLILCEITSQALESAGATVKRSCGMSGSSTVRSALLSGDVDLYWEYTGTGWITFLNQTEPITDPQQLYQAVADRDKQENSVDWLEPAPANNTYAVAISQEKAKELGVTTLSGYADLVTQDAAKGSFCGASEFLGRDDGWPGLEKAYGFSVPDGDVNELAAGPIYDAIDKSDPCNFGEVFATDGRIQALGLTVLQDDKKYFTAYNPAVNIRDAVLTKDPAIKDVLAPVATALDNETLQSLNAKVDVDGETPEQTAKDWLVKEGFVGG